MLLLTILGLVVLGGAAFVVIYVLSGKDGDE
jgi:hypothetical protein